MNCLLLISKIHPFSQQDPKERIEDHEDFLISGVFPHARDIEAFWHQKVELFVLKDFSPTLGPCSRFRFFELDWV